MIGLGSLDDLRPECAVCEKPIDDLSVLRDAISGTTHFRVRCHGEVEEFSVTHRDVVAAGRISLGRAFEKPRVLGAAPRGALTK